MATTRLSVLLSVACAALAVSRRIPGICVRRDARLWNHESPTGYKVVRIVFRDSKPEGFDDFLTGFLVDHDKAHIGRPAGLAVAKDGSLFVSDDSNGVIYRVSYSNVKTS
jgi:glucose/arabinose dehydrogenase